MKFDDMKAEFICQNIKSIKQSLKVHGVICIQGSDLEEDGLYQIASALGG